MTSSSPLADFSSNGAARSTALVSRRRGAPVPPAMLPHDCVVMTKIRGNGGRRRGRRLESSTRGVEQASPCALIAQARVSPPLSPASVTRLCRPPLSPASVTRLCHRTAALERLTAPPPGAIAGSFGPLERPRRAAPRRSEGGASALLASSRGSTGSATRGVRAGRPVSNSDRWASAYTAQQRLNFFPDPHGQGSLRPTLAGEEETGSGTSR